MTLVGGFGIERLNSRQARWSLFSRFHFILTYHPRPCNVKPGALSRQHNVDDISLGFHPQWPKKQPGFRSGITVRISYQSHHLVHSPSLGGICSQLPGIPPPCSQPKKRKSRCHRLSYRPCLWIRKWAPKYKPGQKFGFLLKISLSRQTLENYPPAFCPPLFWTLHIPQSSFITSTSWITAVIVWSAVTSLL